MKTFAWTDFVIIWVSASIGAVIGCALRERKKGDMALGIADGILHAILFAFVLACLWFAG